ncbi:MAG: hypothetical protein MUF34_07520 [Polyangiaceae bacterium]|jgi:carbonic anhydrase|nr:hypothetical protein [Polyangiaceae bacterium]
MQPNPLAAPFDDAAVACCSEDFAASRLVVDWRPRVVLQTWGGLLDPDESATAATLAYAFDELRLGRLIVVTHEGCTADPRQAAERLRGLLEAPRLCRWQRRGVVVHVVASGPR